LRATISTVIRSFVWWVGYPKCIKPVILGHFVGHVHSGLDSPILFEVFSKIPTHSDSDSKASSNERFLLQLQPMLAMIGLAWTMISYVWYTFIPHMPV
jgi:hypothetical protein